MTLMCRNLSGDHAALILIFVAPLFWFIKSTGLLLVVQSVVVNSEWSRLGAELREGRESG